ncbi:hypothetical protein [Endozoicomonas sp. 4G]|uniref:hypothetical protein n=1 Tax=Endozoicomonas sp. 4G TaxID=2872754 RepID=UPI002078C9B8|nr:hypothetical protein [Endozoicomonas sp. 4G]
MLSKKPLILTLAVIFSIHCSNGRAQENRLPLLWLLTRRLSTPRSDMARVLQTLFTQPLISHYLHFCRP